MTFILPILVLGLVAVIVAASSRKARTSQEKTGGITDEQAAAQIKFQVEMRKRLLQITALISLR